MSGESTAGESKVLESQTSNTVKLKPSEKLKDPGKLKTAFSSYVPLTALFLSGKEMAMFPVALLNVAVRKLRLVSWASDRVIIGLPQAPMRGP